MSLFAHMVVTNRRIGIWTEQDAFQVDARHLVVIFSHLLTEQVNAANHIFHATDTEASHDFTQFASQEEHQVFYVFRFAFEITTQFFILGRNAVRTRIQVTYAGHLTANSYERQGTETEHFSAEQRSNRYVEAGHELTVYFEDDTVTQAVQKQGLMRFRQAQFPRCPGMTHAGTTSCTGTTIVTADEDVVCFRFRNTGSDSTNAGFRSQLNADARIAVRILQVEDQFSQIFDRVNIMMWRRGY